MPRSRTLLIVLKIGAKLVVGVASSDYNSAESTKDVLCRIVTPIVGESRSLSLPNSKYFSSFFVKGATFVFYIFPPLENEGSFRILSDCASS